MKKIVLISIIYTFSFTLLHSQKDETKPFILGEIATLQSTELGEKRFLNIYLPEGYSPDSAKTYPVIYLLDGSADEDFIHIVGLVQFANFPWVNLLPPSIVVGIANVDRKRDFTFPTSIEKDKKDYPTTGNSAKFINFIEAEVQPFIQKNYKTSAEKTIIGQSLGGLLATEILFKKPHLFNNYIIISPSLWWDKESLFAFLPTRFNQKTRVYIGVGEEGKIMKRDAKQLLKKLKGLKTDKLSIRFEYFKKENHANILHQAVYNAFKIK
jgi:uncharacterized protein